MFSFSSVCLRGAFLGGGVLLVFFCFFWFFASFGFFIGFFFVILVWFGFVFVLSEAIVHKPELLVY